MKHPLYIFILLVFSTIISASGQEVMQSLDSNPSLLSPSNEYTRKSGSAGSNQPQVVSLPFWDDFSYDGPYPDPLLWADNFVFINNSYAVHPKTIGVATFDALDEHGSLYGHMTASNTPHIADYLTSQHIRLDSVFSPVAKALSPADSVILSFYYQPQGRAGDPVRQDSLVVEFLHTPGRFIIDDEGEIIWVEDVWRSVWHTEGVSLQVFAQDTFPYFKRAVIRITDPVYFRKDFRFRFKNHVSFPIEGNPTLQNNTGMRAVWNVDYILLDHNRRTSQQHYFDIAFAAPPQSILKNYTQMPWAHFIERPQNHLRESFSMQITNLDNITFPYVYRYIIQDEQGNGFRNYSGGTWNIAPFATSGYQQYQPHAKPIVIANPLPTAPAAERHFNIVHVIRAGSAGDSHLRNDTVTYRQSFTDMYAYDDGIPEAGYGVVGRNPKIANRFVVEKSDELSHVDIYFNPNVGNSNADRAYKVFVWKQIGPEDVVLYESASLLFSEYGDGLNTFFRYELSQRITVADTIYIGIQQQGNAGVGEFISIGFDKGNDAGQHIFYTRAGTWDRSVYSGALMIRPVFDNTKTTLSSGHTPASAGSIRLFPNPLSGQNLHITLPDNGQVIEPVRMDIFDMYGKMIHSGPFTHTFDATNLPNGMYFLRVLHSMGKVPETTPFIIAR